MSFRINNRLLQKYWWKSKFCMNILDFGSYSLNEKRLKLFSKLDTKTFLEAFSNKLIVHDWKIDGYPNLVTLFLVSEVLVLKIQF